MIDLVTSGSSEMEHSPGFRAPHDQSPPPVPCALVSTTRSGNTYGFEAIPYAEITPQLEFRIAEKLSS